MKNNIQRISTRNRFSLGLLTIIAGFVIANPAVAQHYNPYGGQQPGYERDYYRPRPQYRDERYFRPRREAGSVCVTSRGSCETGGGYIGAPCRCKIPGFGAKRGSIQY